ncbi:MAG: hypothetical protein PHQ43_03910 [Dehalococcoidales bacterium]|jgi:hypothetical protein|nr:hypothetical protein [Dehalococcoidales bacterium]
MPGEFYIEGKAEKLDITDIKELISQIQTSITGIQSDITQVVVSSGNQLLCMDFWSETVDEAEVEIDAAGETKELPAVTVEKLPSGASVLRAVAMFKFRMLENTNAGANRLNVGTVPETSQVIQVREDTPGAWGDAINFVDTQYAIEGETREGGDVCFGTIDVSNIVNGNGVYEFQWLLARPLLNYMIFCDVQMGVRVWYSVAPG